MKPISLLPSAKPLAGSQTLKNLIAAYIAESCAYSRYTFYADQAKKEDYCSVEQAFRATALNELHHAKVYFRYLPDGALTSVPIEIAAGVIGTTSDNLAEAAREELSEGMQQYLEFARIAREEDYLEIAQRFEAIASVERRHRHRFLRLKEELDTGTLYSRPQPVRWVCDVCGYVHTATEPPRICPACNHPFSHFAPLATPEGA